VKVDPADFKLARQWSKVVQALSQGDEDASGDIGAIGDDGRAFGILQEHPAFFLAYYGRSTFPPDVRDTWTQAFIKAAAAFFEVNTLDHDLDLVVQAFNKGGAAVFINGVRAPEYLAKFHEVYDKL